MKSIQVMLEDNEYDAVEKCKNGLTWREFFKMFAIKEVAELVKKLKK